MVERKYYRFVLVVATAAQMAVFVHWFLNGRRSMKEYQNINVSLTNDWAWGERSVPGHPWRENDLFRPDEGPGKFTRLGKYEAWFYSAFYDRDSGGLAGSIIRLFGLATLELDNKAVVCESLLPSGQTVTTKGILRKLSRDQNRVNPSAHVECSLNDGQLPVAVTLSFNESKSDPIPIVYRFRKNSKKKFTVCYSALHSEFNSTVQLVTSLELNMILGAEHFYIYNTSISKDVDTILRHYQDRGVLTVIQWPVPFPEKTWNFAQGASLNDCTYRNRNRSEFVVNVDTDEFIIPRGYLSWYDMLIDLLSDPTLTFMKKNTERSEVPVSSQTFPRRRLLTKKVNQLVVPPGQPTSSYSQEPSSDEELTLRRKTIAGFSFRCVFYDKLFTKPWEEMIKSPTDWSLSADDIQFISKYEIQPLKVFFRTRKAFGDTVRSKTMFRPEYVYTTATHLIRTAVKGSRPAFVHPHVALLHHYRPHNKDLIGNDYTAFKFKDELIKRLKFRFAALPYVFGK